jgi:NADP-reducing hydrogenase subunit HndD
VTTQPLTVQIDDRPVQVPPGATLLDAARAAGTSIPTLCHLPKLAPSGACRICVVEIEGRPGLVPSCAFPATDGMKVKTRTPRVLAARQAVIELLLANHPQECLTCVRNGGCELQRLAEQNTVREVRFQGLRRRSKLDVASAALVRDADKCILCGRCVRVCEEIQGVGAIDFAGRGFQTRVAPAFGQDLNLGTCVGCGQCAVVCPTGALAEQSAEREVWDALHDPERVVVVQTAPAVRVTLGEALGLPAGEECTGRMVAALRRIGFDKVFDTDLAADLTIMEEGSELVERIKHGGPFPLFTSCSPAWVRFVETFHPELLPNLSSCKSPQQMMGALVKSFWAYEQNVDPRKIFSVSVMPCTAKKAEARRPEMGRDGLADVDAVLTTRELIRLIRRAGIDFASLPNESHDDPLGLSSGAGDLFGTSGGVAEAALRTAHFLVTGREMERVEVHEVRGDQTLREAEIPIGDLSVRLAVVSSLGAAHKLVEQIRKGEKQYHFVEVMSCPGGCISGGGQPHGVDRVAVARRREATYALDSRRPLRRSHDNGAVRQLYAKYFEAPLSHQAHRYLHTHYQAVGA